MELDEDVKANLNLFILGQIIDIFKLHIMENSFFMKKTNNNL
jgi:hypothetical protein